MNWKHLSTEEELENLITESKSHPVLIFKHSQTCSISQIAYIRLEKAWEEESPVDIYEVDVHESKNISQKIAEDFGIQHESPQVILLENGESVYDASHLDIDPNVIESKIA